MTNIDDVHGDQHEDAGNGQVIDLGMVAPELDTAVEALLDGDQRGSDRDQTGSDRDQTGSDRDQTASDADQTTSDRDQAASDRDQKIANQDQAASDRDHQSGGDDAAYHSSRAARHQSMVERDLASHARAQTSDIRDAAGTQRDLVARKRDQAARDRDRVAEARDAEIDRWERSAGDSPRMTGEGTVHRSANDRRQAAEDRARAANQRVAAARDREHAALDREQAALDRGAAAQEAIAAGIDHLTRTLTRRVGLFALQREIARVQRTKDPLVVAFIDVDKLKAVNDGNGHGAGDRLLSTVARLLGEELRPYDLIIRFGGDEFLCCFSGASIDTVRLRFDHISAELSATTDGASISFGLAQLEPEESMEQLIERADAAMITTRARTRGLRQTPPA